MRFALTDHKVYSGKPEQKAFIRGRSVANAMHSSCELGVRVVGAQG